MSARGEILFCAPTGVGHCTPMLAFAIAVARKIPECRVTVFTPLRQTEVSKCGMIDESNLPSNFRRRKFVLPGPVDPVTMEGMSRFSEELCADLLDVFREDGSFPSIIVHDPFALYASRLSRETWNEASTYLFSPSPFCFSLCMMLAGMRLLDASHMDPAGVDYGFTNLPGVPPIPIQTTMCASLDLERHHEPTLLDLSSMFGMKLRGVLSNDSTSSFPDLQGLTTSLVGKAVEGLKADLPESRKLQSYPDTFKLWNVQEAIASERVGAKDTCESSTDLFNWLNSQNAASVTLVCFGTLYTPADSDLFQLEAALRNTTGRSVLYVSKDAAKTRKRLAEASHIRVESWVPLLNVLANDAIGLCVMHGGWNTLQENFFYAGKCAKPVIVFPLGSDQFMLAEVIQRHFKTGKSALVCLKDIGVCKESQEDLDKERELAIEAAVARVRKGICPADFARPQHPEFYRYLNEAEWTKLFQKDWSDEINACKNIREKFDQNYQCKINEQLDSWISDVRIARN